MRVGARASGGRGGAAHGDAVHPGRLHQRHAHGHVFRRSRRPGQVRLARQEQRPRPQRGPDRATDRATQRRRAGGLASSAGEIRHVQGGGAGRGADPTARSRGRRRRRRRGRRGAEANVPVHRRGLPALLRSVPAAAPKNASRVSRGARLRGTSVSYAAAAPRDPSPAGPVSAERPRRTPRRRRDLRGIPPTSTRPPAGTASST